MDTSGVDLLAGLSLAAIESLPDADAPMAPIEEFENDGLNRRIRKTVTNWGTGIVMDLQIDDEGVQAGDREERYFYAGWRVIEERTGGGDVIALQVRQSSPQPEAGDEQGVGFRRSCMLATMAHGPECPGGLRPVVGDPLPSAWPH